jgi:hypothetical protein
VSDEPAGGMPRIISKLRQQGPSWIAKRLSAEAANPTTRPGRLIHTVARWGLSTGAGLSRMLQKRAAPKFVNLGSVLYAFYDLDVAPITFDFLWFLTAADLCRRRLGARDIHVVIVPGRCANVRRERADYEVVVPVAARQERIQTILFEASRLLPSCAGITLAVSRPEAQVLRSSARHVFPKDYDIRLPSFPTSRMCLEAAHRGERPIAVLRATSQRRADVERWLRSRGLGARQLITVTLRGYDYMRQRNSNLTAWRDFARSLDATKFLCVFVPDTEQTIEGLPSFMDGMLVFSEAAWSVGTRMALYEIAYLNMGVNTGPMGLCWLNERAHYVTLKMAPAGVPQTTVGFLCWLGFAPGESLPFATPTQELVWEDDSLDAIVRAFDRVTAAIAKSGKELVCK